MTNMELADELDAEVKNERSGKIANLMMRASAALRRGPERPLSGEMVMVPSKDIERLIFLLEVFAEFGMEAQYKNGDPTENAELARKFALQLSKLREVAEAEGGDRK